jgi:hypothetical protein
VTLLVIPWERAVVVVMMAKPKLTAMNRKV